MFGEEVSPDQMFGDRVSPDQVFGEKVSPDQVFGEKVSPDRVFGEKISPDQVKNNIKGLGYVSGLVLYIFRRSAGFVLITGLECEESKYGTSLKAARGWLLERRWSF